MKEAADLAPVGAVPLFDPWRTGGRRRGIRHRAN
jgi:hypothetical protein